MRRNGMGFCGVLSFGLRGRGRMKVDKHDYYMGEALAEADKALGQGEVPVGAVVVREGVIIAREHNLKEKLKDATAHAEILAIRAAGVVLNSWRLSDCTLYVTIEPCPMCAGAMLQARLPRLVFGARDEKGGAVGSLYNLTQDKRFNHYLEVLEGVRAEESAAFMRGFFQARR